MKLNFIIAFCVLTYASLAQSKKETIDWLNGKFYVDTLQPNCLLDVAGSKDINYYRSFIKFKIDGTYQVTRCFYKDVGTNPIVDEIEYGNLCDLNPDTITSSGSDCILFSVICTNSKKAIKLKSKSGKLLSTKSILELPPIQNENETEIKSRIVKALRHLIELYGGKHDTF